MPRHLGEQGFREVEPLRADQDVRGAVEAVLAADLPALPVVDADGRAVGVFGEREFIAGIFPGYLGEMRYAGFLKKGVEDRLELREGCLGDPVSKYMTTDHVDVPEDWADVQIAEVFLHHRVLIVPVVRDGRVLGVIPRSAFFRAVAESALGP